MLYSRILFDNQKIFIGIYKKTEKNKILLKYIHYRIMEKINRIKAVLAETGHTGKWLASQLGKDPTTVSKWCTNKIQPDLQVLSTIAALLDVNIRDLLVDSKK